MGDFNKEILFAPGGKVFIGSNSEENRILKECSMYQIVKEVLPQVYYRLPKRRKEIYEEEILKIARYYMKVQYNINSLFPKGETAAYILQYSTRKLTEFDFYAPTYKNRNFQVGKYKLTFYRKDKNSPLFEMGERAKLVELFRYIGPYSFKYDVRKQLKEIIKKYRFENLKADFDVPKWMEKEFDKIKKIQEI